MWQRFGRVFCNEIIAYDALIAEFKALKIEAPRFNKKKFEEAVKYALTLTGNHEEFHPLIRKTFLETGVIFVILPNIAGSKTNGATKIGIWRPFHIKSPNPFFSSFYRPSD